MATLYKPPARVLMPPKHLGVRAHAAMKQLRQSAPLQARGCVGICQWTGGAARVAASVNPETTTMQRRFSSVSLTVSCAGVRQVAYFCPGVLRFSSRGELTSERVRGEANWRAVAFLAVARASAVVPGCS